jgi:hypothetical protein
MKAGVFGAALVLSLWAAPAGAEHAHAPLPGSDGVYGRLDGSLTLAANVGAELEDGEPRAALRISGHYLWIAGAYARYSDAFGGADLRPSRVASFGVDLRPLFLPRFARNWEQGPALLDLSLDSLSLSAGAYFSQPQARDFGTSAASKWGWVSACRSPEAPAAPGWICARSGASRTGAKARGCSRSASAFTRSCCRRIRALDRFGVLEGPEHAVGACGRDVLVYRLTLARQELAHRAVQLLVAQVM